jgi:glycosyltransferase involved in cell wall biosynthesis
VVVPEDARYSGELERGLVVINNLASRGRRLGSDVFSHVREHVPLDLIGMGATEMGGLGEVKLPQLPAFAARYRFFFNPIRYTSLGLAVCEAMMVGLPIVGLATTEMVTVIENGVHGYVDTDVTKLIGRMQALIRDPAEAQRLGANARRYAEERFNIRRFARDWEDTFAYVTG